MRPLAVLRAILLALALFPASALAQEALPSPPRTITVTHAPDAAPRLHLRPRMATTLEFDFPVREPRISGPSPEAITLQQPEPHVLSLYPARALDTERPTTLTLTTEDGAHYSFTLVMDGSLDEKVRVQREEAPPPENPEAPSPRFLLAQDPKHMQQVAFRPLSNTIREGSFVLAVKGTVPLGSFALLILSVMGTKTPLELAEAQLTGAPGALQVLGYGRSHDALHLSLLVQRPEGHADDTPYTLTLRDKQRSRAFVLNNVKPWPAVPPSPPAEVLRPQERPKADANRPLDRKLMRLQRLHPG